MSDIVERLRYTANAGVPDFTNSKLLDEAADVIERLRKENEELRFELKEAEARQPCDDAEFGMKP